MKNTLLKILLGLSLAGCQPQAPENPEIPQLPQGEYWTTELVETAEPELYASIRVQIDDPKGICSDVVVTQDVEGKYVIGDQVFTTPLILENSFFSRDVFSSEQTVPVVSKDYQIGVQYTNCDPKLVAELQNPTNVIDVVLSPKNPKYELKPPGCSDTYLTQDGRTFLLDRSRGTHTFIAEINFETFQGGTREYTTKTCDDVPGDKYTTIRITADSTHQD